MIVQNWFKIWYYFSVSTKESDHTVVIDYLCLGYKRKFNSMESINSRINRAARLSSKKIVTAGVYTDFHYFTGNFKPSYRWFKRLYNNPTKYNLLTNNCLQNAAYALSLGICSGSYADEYQKALKALTYMTIPNSASFALYHFEKNVSTYYRLPWYMKLFRKDPYYYFYNSIYFENYKYY